MERLVQIDQQFTLWVNQANPPFLNPFWHVLSEAEIWYPMYALIMGFIIWRLGWKKGLGVVLSLFLLVVLTDQISVLVKNSVMRLRPCHDPWMTAHGVLCPDGTDMGPYGFFSSHASNVFGFAACSWLGLQLNDRERRYGIFGSILMIWASLVALSRTMLAAHYLGDILVGSLFGLTMGIALAFLTRRILVRAKL